MKEIIQRKIKLPKEFIDIDDIEVIDLVKFLVTVDGIKYNKELVLEEISLSKLTIDGFKIVSAQINDTKKIIILTGLKDND